MKHTYLLMLFIAGLLLFAGCSRKETFYFSKGTGSFKAHLKMKKVENSQDRIPANFFQAEPKEAAPIDAPVLTALAPSGDFSSEEHLLTLEQPVNSIADAPPGTWAIPLALIPPNVKSRQQAAVHTIQDNPVDGMRVNRYARAGVLLGASALLLALIAVALGPVSFLLAGLAATGALLTSIIGLKQIKKNPGTFAGKGQAIAGIIMGSVVLAVFLLGVFYILAFAGAFSG